jgi:AbiV family abortive infection protein
VSYIKKEMITYLRLSTWGIIAFKNGLRLHFDSIILFKNRAYASAIMLSILAMEEFGKYFLLSSYVFYTRVSNTRDVVFEKEFLNKLYEHAFKQAACFGRDGFFSSQSNLNETQNRYYENLKQKAIYVGFERKGGYIDFSKRINNPENIRKSKALNQISFLNDLIISIVTDHIQEKIDFDEEEVNELLNEELLRKLIKSIS